MTSIASGSLSGSSVTLSSISSSYVNLFLVIRDYYASSNFGLHVVANSITDYTYVQQYTNSTTSSGSGQYTEIAAASMACHANLIAGSDNNNFTSVNIYDYANSVRKTYVINSALITSTSIQQSVNNFGGINMSAAINALTISTSVGTFSGGTYILYGVK